MVTYVHPYRTSEHRIEGAVLVFVDIDLLHRILQDTQEARDFAEAIVNTVRNRCSYSHPISTYSAQIRLSFKRSRCPERRRRGGSCTSSEMGNGTSSPSSRAGRSLTAGPAIR